MTQNIYYNNAIDPYEPKLIEMNKKKGKNYPGWIRLSYEDEDGYKKKYFG
jgi:hypothetical protein